MKNLLKKNQIIITALAIMIAIAGYLNLTKDSVTDEKEKMDEDDLDDLKDMLKENYGIAKKSVKKALEVEVEATIKGKDDEDTQEQDMIIVKIDNKWYITDIFEALKYYAY